MQRDELLRVVTADTDWMINITKNDQIGKIFFLSKHLSTIFVWYKYPFYLIPS